MTSVTKNKKPSKMKKLRVLKNRFGLVKLKTADLSNRQGALFSLLLVPVSATEYSSNSQTILLEMADAARCDWLEHPAYVQQCNSKYGGFY